MSCKHSIAIAETMLVLDQEEEAFVRRQKGILEQLFDDLEKILDGSARAKSSFSDSQLQLILWRVAELEDDELLNRWIRLSAILSKGH